MRPLRGDDLTDRGIVGQAVDRVVEVHVQGDQPRQRRGLVDRTPGAQRRLEVRAPGSIGLAPDTSGCELGGQRVDGAAHLIELADAQGIELRYLKALASAFGDQPLAVQQMQRVTDRLARDAELFRKLALADAVPRRQREVGDAIEDPGIDLIDQIGGRIERDHTGVRFWNTEFRTLEIAGGSQPVKGRALCARPFR